MLRRSQHGAGAAVGRERQHGVAAVGSESAGTGGGSRGPARRAAWEGARLDRRLQAFGFALHTATQIASLLAWSTLPASERAQRVGSIAVQLAFLLLPWLVPAFYLRWRRPILIVERIQFFMWPLLRQPKGIQSSLNREPKSGPRGALQDLLRCIWGSRLVAVCLAPLVQPLSVLGLLPQAALQLYAVVMVRGNRSVCAAPLLMHATSKARIHTLHSVMRLVALLLPGGAGHELTRPGRMSAEQECAAFFTYIGLTVGVLLPLWLLVKTEPSSSLAKWEAAWHSAAEGQGRVARPPLHRLAACLEAGLRALLGRSWLSSSSSQQWRRQQPQNRWQLEGWQRALLRWQLLALAWLCSVALAGA